MFKIVKTQRAVSDTFFVFIRLEEDLSRFEKYLKISERELLVVVAFSKQFFLRF